MDHLYFECITHFVYFFGFGKVRFYYRKDDIQDLKHCQVLKGDRHLATILEIRLKFEANHFVQIIARKLGLVQNRVIEFNSSFSCSLLHIFLY